jgi:hypothetical protein
VALKGLDERDLGTGSVEVLARTADLVVRVAGEVVAEEAVRLFERHDLSREHEKFPLGR